MAFELTRDQTLFKTFWRDERDNMPRWFRDGSNSHRCKWRDFKAFCDRMERIYCIDGGCLVYAERVERAANLHFSLLRGRHITIADLIEILDKLLKEFDMLFCYVGSHNRGLKKIVESCGLTSNGLEMRHSQSHGKVLVWKCYNIVR